MQTLVLLALDFASGYWGGVVLTAEEARPSTAPRHWATNQTPLTTPENPPPPPPSKTPGLVVIVSSQLRRYKGRIDELDVYVLVREKREFGGSSCDTRSLMTGSPVNIPIKGVMVRTSPCILCSGSTPSAHAHATGRNDKTD
jgi:hypothetical protein